MSAAEAEERNNARADAIFDVFDSKSGGVSGIRETVRIAGEIFSIAATPLARIASFSPHHPPPSPSNLLLSLLAPLNNNTNNNNKRTWPLRCVGLGSLCRSQSSRVSSFRR
jgi:hypothetical protein